MTKTREFTKPRQEILDVIKNMVSNNEKIAKAAQEEFVEAWHPMLTSQISINGQVEIDNDEYRVKKIYADWKKQYNKELRWDIIARALQILERGVLDFVKDKVVQRIKLYPSYKDIDRVRMVVEIHYD